MHDPGRHVSSMEGLDILFVMATTHEYGPHLRARIDPLICGVGPVEAAIATTIALAALARRERLPDLVFTLGSAGSRRLEHAGIYQMASVGYRDMDASALGFEKGVTPFLDEPAVIAIPHQIEGIPAASLATGASVVSGDAYEGIAADMADMESFAVVRAARRFDVPTIGLRGISDGRSELTGIGDWTEYLHIIDERLATAIELFEERLRDGSLIIRSPADRASFERSGSRFA